MADQIPPVLAALSRLTVLADAIEAGCDLGWAYVGHIGADDGGFGLTLKPALLLPQDEPGQAPEPVGIIQEDPNLCGWEDCQTQATTALRFRDQPGHVHNCDPHAALHREWCDVIESVPLPNCPFSHGATWTDYPRDL
ncbi:hypothetical protein [Streptomyces malaysiensis]|uniref:hypothetical protein n=1 Tax=Streptomyces malaysiensis TaxID=92644 RepID=UPI0036A61FE5